MSLVDLPSPCQCARSRTLRVETILIRHSLSVGQMIFRAVSFTLYMMSVRSWHIVQTVFHGSSVHCSSIVHPFNQRFCRRCSLGTRSRHWFCVFGAKNSDDTSDVLRFRFNRVPTNCDHDHAAQKEYLSVLLCQSSHYTHHDLARQVLEQSLKFTARAKQQSVINMKMLKVTISESTSGLSEVTGNSDFADATVLVLFWYPYIAL